MTLWYVTSRHHLAYLEVEAIFDLFVTLDLESLLGRDDLCCHVGHVVRFV